MNFAQYQTDARSTAIYPLNVEFLYPSLGLAGETGELCDKMFGGAHQDEIKKEMGDVLWYVSNVATDCDLLLNEIAKCDNFNEIAPIVTDNDTIVLVSQVGVVCEMAKKTARDDKGRITFDRQARVFTALELILRLLSSMCDLYPFTLAEVAEANIAKLKSRQERGVLQGSGDNR